MKTMRTMSTTYKPAATLLGAILLISGCGGGSSSSNDDPAPIAVVGGTDVPVSATQSLAGTLAFAAQLQATSSDSGDPVMLGDAILVGDDSAEPGAV